MKRLLIRPALILSLGAMIAFAACNRGGSTPSNTSPSAPGSSPAQVSSSADVVKIASQVVSLRAGGSVDSRVVLLISPGFHVNANPATFPNLIATQVTAGKVEGITTGAPVYPPAEKKKFQFADQPLAVYEGEAPVKLNILAEKNMAVGPRTLPISILVQACDEEKCYPPATVKSTIEVTVK
jgi:hypothetical protein